MKRKKEELIPLEKSKKVIYLDRRGKSARRRDTQADTSGHIAALVCGVLALCCLVYCLSMFFFVGFGSRFFLIWGVIAVFFGVLAFLLEHREWRERLPKWLRLLAAGLFAAGVICLIGVEGLILSCWRIAAAPGADYVIVLGAQWKSNGPSYILQKRLDTALAYLQENPDTYVIVSGGQGANEPISEAAGMKRYLTERGIAEERIVMEAESTSTVENLLYSGRLLDREESRVVLVTSNFHMYRALRLAEKQGYEKVEGMSAPSYPALVPNCALREFFALVKEKLAGNL